MDKLDLIFEKRRAFMSALRESVPDSYPEGSVDLSTRKSQQLCRDLALRGVEEVFEALGHLKNWKTHRQTEVVADFNHDEFKEEMVDAFNYFLSLMIIIGVDADEFYDAYSKKDKIIHDRIKTGY